MNNGSNLIKDKEYHAHQEVSISAAHRLLVAKCYKKLYPKILSRVGTFYPWRASEITSDIFFKLLHLDHSKIPLQEKHLENYLLKMAVHLCLDRYRQQKLRQHLLTSSGLFRQSFYLPNASDHRIDLEKMLAVLPPAQHACMELLYFGYQYEEIAEILEVSLSAVKNRILRARKSIRRRFVFH